MRSVRGIELLLPILSYVQSNAMISISAKDSGAKMETCTSAIESPLPSFNNNEREIAA